MDWSGISQIAFLTIILTTMLFGLFSLLVVILPGLTIIWVAALIYGIVSGFGTWGWIIFGFMTLQMIIGSISDNFIMGNQARQSGASWLAIGVAILGGVVGSIVFPPFGGIIAALLGIFLVEIIRQKDIQKAWFSFKGMASGCGWAVAFRFLLGCAMIFLWVIWAFVVN